MKIRLIMAMLMAALGLQAQRQQFVNLTASDVELTGDALPHVAFSFPLPGNYADSCYTARLLYPEFVDAPQTVDSLLPPMPSLTHRLALDRKRGALEVVFTPWVWREGRQQILASFMIQIDATPRSTNTPGGRKIRKADRLQAAAGRYADHSVLANGRWVKIRVAETGVHQLTDALIRKAGFNDLSKVKLYGYGGALQNETLREADLIRLDDLKEVPTATVDGRRLFYAQGPVSWEDNKATRRTRNPYSDYGYYFLTQDGDTPASISEEELLNACYPAPEFYHTLCENDGYSWFHGGRNLFDRETIDNGKTKTITLENNSQSATGQLSVSVVAGVASGAQIAINDSVLGTMSFSIPDRYYKGDNRIAVYQVSGLKEQNTVTITCTRGGPLRLDYVSMAWEKIAPAPNLHSADIPVPEYVHAITNQDHHADPQTDMVIIIPTSQRLLQQAERLKAHHEKKDSLRVTIVPADELYNEFSSGTPDANAYRRYMKMLYDRAAAEADMPKYLLLFGDCVWDNRLLTAECSAFDADDLLLCFESENSLHDVYSYVDDGFFGLLDDGEGSNPQSADKLDLAVGRFPVNSEDEAKAMVDKTIAYAENANAGPWQNTLVFMGDDGDNNRHMKDLDNTIEQVSALYPAYVVKKIMWDAYTRQSTSTGYRYPEVTQLIKQYQQTGALIMDYAGHGAEQQISHELVLQLNDFANFSGKNLPLWITASCGIMPFDGVMATIGETAVLNPKGGAVAFFGTTRTVYAAQNKVINSAYLRHVLSKVDGRAVTIGEAGRLAKNELIDRGTDLSTNKLQYSLLGDPALALHQPRQNIIVDSINGVSTNDAATLPQMQAGSIARISGHIDGSDTFNGIVSATVRDNLELITCKLNNTKEADDPFTFYDRTNTLFQGSDSVRNGTFTISFAVPKDINYSNETGLINLHAYNDSRTIDAHGYTQAFTVGGTDVTGNNTTGPSIYCYLNAPSFVNGDLVNTTPYFVAQLTDEDGINASGGSIGHDMELIIDGEKSRTYVLNDNFKFDFGTYTSGTTYYSIPTLEPGEHRLLFRAWDVLNNPSTAELTFHVSKEASPTIYDINCTVNPATTETTFIVTHDRLGSTVDVELEVFDISGRQLWAHTETGVTTDAAYTYDWNLTVDGGRRLDTGVYLYRMRLTSDGMSHTSKAKKLIIL